MLSKRLMVSLVQHADAGARQCDDLVADEMDVELVGAVRLEVLKGEARKVAGARGDAAQRVLRRALYGEGGDELRVFVFEAVQTHVLDLGVIGPRHDFQEVMMLSQAVHRCLGYWSAPSCIWLSSLAHSFSERASVPSVPKFWRSSFWQRASVPGVPKFRHSSFWQRASVPSVPKFCAAHLGNMSVSSVPKWKCSAHLSLL